jgi:aminoglycoside phosphotransferase family enzyme/predicted kinase
VELEELIASLSKPAAYPYACAEVEVRQTHISVVFLAGDCVYKLKKPVKLGFLDFSTLEARRRDCWEEVRLNRRLAAHVYLGVVPVVRVGAKVAFEGEGEAIEWAVKMQRLADEASLLAKLGRGELASEDLERVAVRLASFHRSADRPELAAKLGSFEAVARNARDNFAEMAGDVGVTVSAAVFRTLSDLTETALAALAPSIASRASKSCDGHGDLRLEHIYLFDDEPPADLVIIDCVEFGERFRLGDPVADVAFTTMELLYWGRGDLARAFADAYFRSLGDEEGKKLLSFYVAYRSLVRAKVRGLELREREIPSERRASSMAKARAHFLLALGELADAGSRPMLVITGGLPGTGKSTLARGLAERARAELIRSDVVRKELAGGSGPSGWQQGTYSKEWTLRTYEECLRRAEAWLFEGKRVIVDATFADEGLRKKFLACARDLCVPALWFVCGAAPELVRARLAARKGDASDADWSVYEQARRNWTEPSDPSRAVMIEIDTGAGPDRALSDALRALAERGLAKSAS